MSMRINNATGELSLCPCGADAFLYKHANAYWGECKKGHVTRKMAVGSMKEAIDQWHTEISWCTTRISSCEECLWFFDDQGVDDTGQCREASKTGVDFPRANKTEWCGKGIEKRGAGDAPF